MINGFIMFAGLFITQVANEELGPPESIYTVEYGNTTGRKILNGEWAGYYRVDNVAKVSSHEQEFLNLVNNWRAGYGRPPVGWSQAADDLAATNDSVHAPHSIYGSQIWAGVGDFASAFNLWIASPAHSAILLSINTAIGVSKCVTGCTANGY